MGLEVVVALNRVSKPSVLREGRALDRPFDQSGLTMGFNGVNADTAAKRESSRHALLCLILHVLPPLHGTIKSRKHMRCQLTSTAPVCNLVLRRPGHSIS